MKIIATSMLCISFFATTFFAKAQTIPNGDFENWDTSGKYWPRDWFVPVDPFGGTVISSTDHVSGDFSVRINGTYKPHQLDAGISLFKNNSKLTYTNIVSKYLIGYMKYQYEGLIRFQVHYIRNSDNKEVIGFDSSYVYENNSWIPFHVSILIPQNYIPDSFGIDIIVNGGIVLIDNLSFSNTPIGNEVGISSKELSSINSSLYPNPTNGNAEIDFSLTSSSNINIKIYDLTGRLVKTVLNEKRFSGVQKVQLNLEELQNGIYFYTITGDGFSETKKFIVSK